MYPAGPVQGVVAKVNSTGWSTIVPPDLIFGIMECNDIWHVIDL